MINNNLSELLWAKSSPYKGLKEHMKEVAIVCDVLLKDSQFSCVVPLLEDYLQIGKEDVVALVTYLAGLHDIGKCHPLFQIKGEDTEINTLLSSNGSLRYPFEASGYRHEFGSASAAKRIWKKNSLFERDIIRCLSSTLKLHHQGRTGCDYSLIDDTWPGSAAWAEEQEKLELWLREWLLPPNIMFHQVKQLDAACSLITSMIIISDWIASGDMFSDFTSASEEQEVISRTKEFIQKSGIKKGTVSIGNFRDLWPMIPVDGLRPIQSDLDHYFSNERRVLPLLLIIEAPMGEGKTEAGLFAALKMSEYWRKNGVYIALPTAATSNQMYGRVSALLCLHRLGEARLMHGMSWVEQDNLPRKNDEIYNDVINWTAPSKLALLSPYAVGTVDQVMMSVLRIRLGVLRLLGITSKVLVIDEVHAYDAYMSSIIKRLLEWCRVLCVPVVMLSATLPSWKKQEYIDIYGGEKLCSKAFQQYTAVYDNGITEQRVIEQCTQKKEVAIQMKEYAPNEERNLMQSVLDRIAKGGCACIIVNTVNRAQQLYIELKSIDPNIETLLFHSAFTVGRRSEIERQCILWYGKDTESRPKKSILIATQVVEQSLDLDFDFMVSEIAPIDLILQRIGRLHRHNDTIRPQEVAEPECWVIIPKDGNYGGTGYIYYELLLERTQEILSKRTSISIPEDIPLLVDEVYQRDSFQEEETEKFLEQLFSEQVKESIARGIELHSPLPDDFGLGESHLELLGDGEDTWTSAKTRLGEETVRIAVLPKLLFDKVRSLDSNGKRVDAELAKTIMLYSVSVTKKRWVMYGGASLSDSVILGTGRLEGIIMICSGQDDCLPTDNIIFNSSGFTFVVDKELGVLYRKKTEVES